MIFAIDLQKLGHLNSQLTSLPTFKSILSNRRIQIIKHCEKLKNSKNENMMIDGTEYLDDNNEFVVIG